MQPPPLHPTPAAAAASAAAQLLALQLRAWWLRQLVRCGAAVGSASDAAALCAGADLLSLACPCQPHSLRPHQPSSLPPPNTHNAGVGGFVYAKKRKGAPKEEPKPQTGDMFSANPAFAAEEGADLPEPKRGKDGREVRMCPCLWVGAR